MQEESSPGNTSFGGMNASISMNVAFTECGYATGITVDLFVAKPLRLLRCEATTHHGILLSKTFRVVMKPMNTDFSARIVIATESMEWRATTETGCWCKHLDQSDEAAASTTNIVKYAPGASLNPHLQNQGEEILVLEGALTDGQTAYSTGVYLRNPPGSHSPLRTDHGCVLFIKRYPFDADDTDVERIDQAASPWVPGLVPGLSVMPLHQHRHEQAALVRWKPGTYFQPHAHVGGEEILVLSGVFEDEHGRYPTGTWIRSPHLSRHKPFSREGCTIYVKTGHLA